MGVISQGNPYDQYNQDNANLAGQQFGALSGQAQSNAGMFGHRGIIGQVGGGLGQRLAVGAETAVEGEALLEQIEGGRARRDEEDENPDGPVGQPVIDLVAVPQLAGAGEFDSGGGSHWCDRRALAPTASWSDSPEFRAESRPAA